MKGISPSSIYMGDKGAQQYNVGQCPYKKPTIKTCRLTQMNFSTPMVNMASYKVMSYRIRAPR
jgi:hypothetical protein